MAEPSTSKVPFIPSTPQKQTTLTCAQDFPWPPEGVRPWLTGQPPARLNPGKAGLCGSVTCRGHGGKQEMCHGSSNVLDEFYASSAKVKVKNE